MSNQSITQDQWQSVVDAAQKHVLDLGIPEERLYINFREKFRGGIESNGYRSSICDNYDDFWSPAIHFDYDKNINNGKIRVYNNSEQASAPVSLTQALNIASNMFTEDGNLIAETIVVDYVDQQANSL